MTGVLVFEKKFIAEAITRSAETELDRRKLFAMMGIAGVGAATLAATAGAGTAFAAAPQDATSDASDASILNFALNLEYLEAEFYLRATTGAGLPENMTTGLGTRGGVSGGRKVHFASSRIRKYAEEIAKDEKEHVSFLRGALGASAVSRPAISLNASFTAAARAAGIVSSKQTFDPYSSETHFLFAAFLFEDVGVTAYKGAARLLANKTYLDAAAGILAVEAYHAGIIRTKLYDIAADNNEKVFEDIRKLSAARDSLDGPGDDDQGIQEGSRANIVPTDKNGLAYGRTTGRVLNIAYLNPGTVTKGGFFPHGVNGSINTSGPAPANN
jgi:rubrerythrin